MRALADDDRIDLACGAITTSRLDRRIRNAFEVIIAERHESIGDEPRLRRAGCLLGMRIGDAGKYSNARKSSFLTPSPAAYMRPNFHWATTSPALLQPERLWEQCAGCTRTFQVRMRTL
jgi:hypothetical protein